MKLLTRIGPGFLAVAALLPLTLGAASLNIAYYHAPRTTIEWTPGAATAQTEGEQVEDAVVQLDGSQHMTMNVRSNLETGYLVSVDMKRLGDSNAAAPKVALEALKRGQLVGQAQLSGNLNETASLDFTGNALKRTGRSDSVPDQVRVRVKGVSGDGKPSSALDVVTMTVSTR